MNLYTGLAPLAYQAPFTHPVLELNGHRMVNNGRYLEFARDAIPYISQHSNGANVLMERIPILEEGTGGLELKFGGCFKEPETSPPEEQDLNTCQAYYFEVDTKGLSIAINVPFFAKDWRFLHSEDKNLHVFKLFGSRDTFKYDSLKHRFASLTYWFHKAALSRLTPKWTNWHFNNQVQGYFHRTGEGPGKFLHITPLGDLPISFAISAVFHGEDGLGESTNVLAALPYFVLPVDPNKLDLSRITGLSSPPRQDVLDFPLQLAEEHDPEDSAGP